MALLRKKDAGPSPATEPAPAQPDLAELTGQLGRLAELLAQTNHQIAEYLARRESQSATHQEQLAQALGAELSRLAEKLDQLAPTAGDGDAAAGDTRQWAALIEPLGERLERLESKLETIAAAQVAADQPGAGRAAPEILDALDNQSAAIARHMEGLRGQLERGFEELTGLLQPPTEPEPEQGPSTATSAEWQRAILGPDLAQNPALAFQREQLVGGVLEGDPAACGLAGQLLTFQAAPPERLPQLLKEIGEAYYRWQPKQQPGTTPMEEALVAWLHRRCEAAGIYNTIELVHPGQRYDAARHTASSRGVEISQVYGWIVLRDNGRVYMKASVSVR